MPSGSTGLTPMATRQTSASRVSLAAPSTVMLTLLPSVLAAVVLVLVKKRMPAFLKDFSRVWLTSVSSTGRRFGAISTIGHLVP
jgi:hypothetical protein